MNTENRTLIFLITLLALAGCSETPYTGSMLTPDDVNWYITKDGETYCLVNGTDSTCLTPPPTVEIQDADAPIIHIFPQKIVYILYREGVPVLTAEKVVDTTEIVEKLTEPEPEPAPEPEPEPPSDPDYRQTPESEPEFEPEPEPEPESPVDTPPPVVPEPEPEPEPPPPPIVEGTSPPENTQPPPPQPPPPRRANTGDEWLIKIYYDVDPMPLADAEKYAGDRVTLPESGFSITINEVPITDDDITSQAGIVEADVDSDGFHRPGFQFIYRTTATELVITVELPYSGPVEQLKISGF